MANLSRLFSFVISNEVALTSRQNTPLAVDFDKNDTLMDGTQAHMMIILKMLLCKSCGLKSPFLDTGQLETVRVCFQSSTPL